MQEAMAFSKEMAQQRVTDGVRTEIIWDAPEARTAKDIQEILEFWLAAEHVDLWDPAQFRTDGTQSTFLFRNVCFITMIFPDLVFDYANMLAVFAHVMSPPAKSYELLDDLNGIQYPGGLRCTPNDQFDSGWVVVHEQQIFGEHKSVQFALSIALNSAVNLVESLAPRLVSQHGGRDLFAGSLSGLVR